MQKSSRRFRRQVQSFHLFRLIGLLPSVLVVCISASTCGLSEAARCCLSATDYSYEPSNLTVPAGRQVTLHFTNDGSVEHYFVVGDSVIAD